MTADNGWPDPQRPGVPMRPKRDGWHWLVPAINPALPPGAYRWHAPPRDDVVGQWDAGHPLDVVRRGYAYLGPCLTPAEVAAAVAQARREAEVERDEFFNMLGRITEELHLPVDCTAGRIIEAIRQRVDDEREACASVDTRVEVPDGADQWTPLEAWEEALIAATMAFRAAIRARAAEGAR